MNYQNLISSLKQELSTKITPGPILDSLMFKYLDKFGQKYPHNNDLLMVGALLGDIRIDEAKELGDKSKHVELALDYAKQLYDQYNVSENEQEVISEIISTHHGGEQKYIESKIYKNADNFKFLDTKGCLHFFGVLYTGKDQDHLEDTVEKVNAKLDEKLELTDLDEETVKKAKELYDYNIEVLNKILL